MLNKASHARAKALLLELYDVLSDINERNWIRGVSIALYEIHLSTEDGYENARSIYLTMTSGGRGLSEYVPCDEDGEILLIQANILERIREDLWHLFCE